MNITVKQSSLDSLKAAIEGTTRKIKSELRVAINATAAKSKSILNKEIRSELAVTAKVVSSTIRTKRKSEGNDLSATVEVKKTARISLKEFGARQGKKGTSYKISKTKGRKTISDAFQGPKPGLMKASWKGNVFKRAGKARLPIVKLYGPSPFGVLTKGKKLEPSLKQTEAELVKQVQRRIRLITLKKTGAI